MSEYTDTFPGGVMDPRRVERYILSTTRSGRAIMAPRPIFDPRPEFNGTQKSMRRIVRRAVTYAEFACDDTIYQCKATGSTQSAYHLALMDYLEKPKVQDIDLRSWLQGVGQTIRIQARDDFMVLSVRLVIRKGDVILEEGEAKQSESDGMEWTYTTRTSVARKPGLNLDAYAYDLPGNVGEYHLELR